MNFLQEDLDIDLSDIKIGDDGVYNILNCLICTKKYKIKKIYLSNTDIQEEATIFL